VAITQCSNASGKRGSGKARNRGSRGKIQRIVSEKKWKLLTINVGSHPKWAAEKTQRQEEIARANTKIKFKFGELECEHRVPDSMTLGFWAGKRGASGARAENI